MPPPPPSPASLVQVGIGTPISPENAIKWYKLAAENGDKRAANRLTNFSKPGGGGGVNHPNGNGSAVTGATREELLARATEGGDVGDGNGKKEKDCVIM